MSSRKQRKDLLPGTLKATPAASRKTYKVEGLNSDANKQLLEKDVASAPRWHVQRMRLSAPNESGGTIDGDIVIGTSLITFMKETNEVSFSQPYSKIAQYGKQGADEIFWVFYPPEMGADPVRYVFKLNEDSRVDRPANTTPQTFWLEEMDRAVLMNERARVYIESSTAVPAKIVSSDKKMELLRNTQHSSLVSLLADPGVQNIGLRKPPSTLEYDRFPVLWIEWKNVDNFVMVTKESEVLVICVPTHPGVIILNPCQGHADFLDAIMCIPWKSVKSWGSKPRSLIHVGLFSFIGQANAEGREMSFFFRTPRYAELEAAFEAFTQERSRHDDLFPTQWPPLRY